MKYWNQEISIIGVDYGVSYNLIYNQYQEIFPTGTACVEAFFGQFRRELANMFRDNIIWNMSVNIFDKYLISVSHTILV